MFFSVLKTEAFVSFPCHEGQVSVRHSEVAAVSEASSKPGEDGPSCLITLRSGSTFRVKGIVPNVTAKLEGRELPIKSPR